MTELAGTVQMIVCAVAITPFVWEVCDHRAARARFDPPVLSHGVSEHRVHADLVTFLTAVERSVRSGGSAAQAIISAPATCVQVSRMQQLVTSGVTVAAAAAASDEHPHVRVLRACLNGDSLSATALDRAVADERFRVQAQHDISVATAQAGRSARILTVLPFVFLLLLAATSSSVRTHLLTPLVGGAVGLGVILNVAGRGWMRAMVARAVLPSPHLEFGSRVASTIALHLCAGGSVADGFGSLTTVDPRCAEVSTMLRDGHMLSVALQPLEAVAPGVVRTILDAHRDGLPVNSAMMRLADDLRAASVAHIQSGIAQVPVRCTTPLVLCTLPSFLLIGIAPMALAALAGLSTPTL